MILLKLCINPYTTGNDLARVLKWGSGYENQNLAPILEDVLFGEEVMFDRFVRMLSQAEFHFKRAPQVAC